MVEGCKLHSQFIKKKNLLIIQNFFFVKYKLLLFITINFQMDKLSLYIERAFTFHGWYSCRRDKLNCTASSINPSLLL